MITHHPSRDVLLAYAAGHVPEAISLILATHLALCPACRDVERWGESFGGAILESLPPEPVSDAVLEQVTRRLNDGVSKTLTEPPQSGGKEAPEPLHSYLGVDFDQVRWIPIAPGLACRPLIAGRCNAKLLRSKPGHGISMHTHKGQEFSLVLSGGYTDSSGHYVRGDFQAANRQLVHRPIADTGDDCTILAVSDAPLTFRNPLIAVLAKVMGY